MPPVLVHRAGLGTVEEICLEATPLGALADCVYPERELELAPGDTLLLLTDGLPELTGQAGEPLGYPRLHELFAAAAGRSPEEVIGHLAAAADAWRGAEAPEDDMTFVVLRVRKETGAASVEGGVGVL
jgi:sigma-B regulation protein RsbU (phosphoserine phosphatase)